MKFKQITFQYRHFIIYLSGFFTICLVYASGIGRYRVVLVYALYYMLKAFYALLKDERKIILLFAPATLIALFYDMAMGAISPLFTKNSLLIAIPVMLIVDQLVSNFVKKTIINISEGELFLICPSCRYFHKDLVEKCQNCSYRKGDQLAISGAEISPTSKVDRIRPGLLSILAINKSEEISFHKKLTFFSQQLKNGRRIIRKHLIITSSNLIILDYHGYHFRIPNNWRERDVVPLSEVAAIEGTMKKFYMTMRPFLMIRTVHGDLFEIVFSTFGNYFDQITDIANIIKKANPLIKVVLNLKRKKTVIAQFASVEKIGIKKMRRLLLMLALALVALAIVLWRLFHN